MFFCGCFYTKYVINSTLDHFMMDLSANLSVKNIIEENQIDSDSELSFHTIDIVEEEFNDIIIKSIVEEVIEEILAKIIEEIREIDPESESESESSFIFNGNSSINDNPFYFSITMADFK